MGGSDTSCSSVSSDSSYSDSSWSDSSWSGSSWSDSSWSGSSWSDSSWSDSSWSGSSWADSYWSDVDPVLAHSILRYLEQLNKEDSITVVCSLHYMDLVRRYASRVVGLKDGRMVYDGSPEDITDERFREIYGQDAERLSVA